MGSYFVQKKMPRNNWINGYNLRNYHNLVSKNTKKKNTKTMTEGSKCC